MPISIASRIIKNTGWLYAKMGITMFISLYTTRLILNGLGANDFGIFNIVGSSIAMLGFINAALATATQRFLNYAEGEGNKEKITGIFNVSIVLHLIISCIIGILLFLLGFIFFNGLLNIPDDRIYAAKFVYSCMIVSTMFTVMTVPYDAVLNAHENMRYYAIIGILESVLKLVVAVFCINTSHDKLILYGLLMAIIPFITLTIMRVYCKQTYQECKLNFKKYYRKSIAIEMSTFAGWTFITTMTSMITQYGLGIILNHFFGVIINAAHGIAMQLTGMLMVFSSNAQKAFNPILTKSEGEKNRSQLIYISLFGCKISFFIFGLFAIPTILHMPYVLSLWLSNVPEWTIVFCRLSLLRILFEQLVMSLVSAINAEGHIKTYSITRSISYILPIPILYILFKNNYEPYWLYIVWIICWSIIGSWITIFVCRSVVGINLKDYLYCVLRPCLIITVLSLVPYFFVRFFDSELSLLLFCIQVFLFLYLGLSFILSKQERFALITLIKGRLFRNGNDVHE